MICANMKFEPHFFQCELIGVSDGLCGKPRTAILCFQHKRSNHYPTFSLSTFLFSFFSGSRRMHRMHFYFFPKFRCNLTKVWNGKKKKNLTPDDVGERNACGGQTLRQKYSV